MVSVAAHLGIIIHANWTDMRKDDGSSCIEKQQKLHYMLCTAARFCCRWSNLMTTSGSYCGWMGSRIY